MAEFKKGDRVAVYGVDNRLRPIRMLATITKVNECGLLDLDTESTYGEYFDLTLVHPKQCRRIKPRKPRRVWIPTDALKEAKQAGADRILASHGDAWCVNIKPPGRMTGWIEFIEVVRKKEPSNG